MCKKLWVSCKLIIVTGILEYNKVWKALSQDICIVLPISTSVTSNVQRIVLNLYQKRRTDEVFYMIWPPIELYPIANHMMSELGFCLQFECCGALSYNDWENNQYFNCSSPSHFKCSVPPSCCRHSTDIHCSLQVRGKAGVGDIIYSIWMSFYANGHVQYYNKLFIFEGDSDICNTQQNLHKRMHQLTIQPVQRKPHHYWTLSSGGVLYWGKHQIL